MSAADASTTIEAEASTTTAPFDVCQDPTVTNKICGPATVGLAPIGTPEPDTCLNIGNGVGQMSLSLMPCDLPNITNASVLAVTCQEDQPCWDCTTMGNLICGPVPNATTSAGTASVAVRTLPSTGTTSAPIVGGATLALVTGVALVLASLRRRRIA